MGGHNMRCAVRGCPSSLRTTKLLRFFALPSDPNRRKQWISLIGRQDILQKSTRSASHRICALHFHPSMLKKKRLHNQTLPSLNLPDDDPESPEPYLYREKYIATYSSKKSFTVQTQTDRTSVSIMREAQTQTDDIGLDPIPLVKIEMEADTMEDMSDEDLSFSDDIDSDVLKELESCSEALLNVKIPVNDEQDQTKSTDVLNEEGE